MEGNTDNEGVGLPVLDARLDGFEACVAAFSGNGGLGGGGAGEDVAGGNAGALDADAASACIILEQFLRSFP